LKKNIQNVFSGTETLQLSPAMAASMVKIDVTSHMVWWPSWREKNAPYPINTPSQV